MKNRHGFTLAEVLITLVIIGVIAAMTIPTLMNKTNEQETVVAVKKAYSILSQAYQRFVADNGELNPSYFGETHDGMIENFGDVFVKYFNVQKNCRVEANTDCWSTQNDGMYKFFDGSTYLSYNEITYYYTVVLNDGTFLAFFLDKPVDYISRGSNESLNNVFGHLHVDVNGDKLPNTVGKDVFAFWITKYGILPIGTPDDTAYPLSSCLSNGSACTAWVITKGNMDYLRKDVSW